MNFIIKKASHLKSGFDRKPCTPERIEYIRTGQLALNDMTASRVKQTLEKEFIDAILSCNKNKKDECKTFSNSSSEK